MKDLWNAVNKSSSESPFLPPPTDARHAALHDEDAAGMAATGVVSMAASTVEVLEEVQPGDGKRFPKTGDKVVVHYTGTFQSNGEVFDCSRERGHAFTFQLGVGRVIKGWDDGVSRLSLGQRVKLLIPWADAYGEKVRCMHTAHCTHTPVSYTHLTLPTIVRV